MNSPEHRDRADQERHNIFEIVSRQDSKIGSLDTKMRSFTNDLNDLKGKMDQVINAVTVQKAADDAKPDWSYSSILANVKDTAILIGMCVVGLVYVINATGGAEQALMQKRLQDIEKKVNVN